MKLYYLSVFLHIVCAAFWIGGMLFLPLVVLPAIRDNPQRSHSLQNRVEIQALWMDCRGAAFNNRGF